MEITIIGYHPVEQMIEVRMAYYQEIDGYGWRADLSVWVPHMDSLDDIRRRAYAAAEDFVSRLQSAHCAPGQ